MNPVEYTFQSFPYPVVQDIDDLEGPYYDAIERDGNPQVVVKLIADAPRLRCKSTRQVARLIRTIKNRSREDDGTFALIFEDTLVIDDMLVREWDKSDWEPWP